MSNLDMHAFARQVCGLPPLAVRVCRQCNAQFGPGQSHFYDCTQHKAESAWARKSDTALADQIRHSPEQWL